MKSPDANRGIAPEPRISVPPGSQIPGIGGIVLCGGASSRMGRPKAWLPFGPEPMLSRVVRIVSEVVSPVIVVAARGQQLPELPAGVQVVHDEVESQGPLAGLAAGLAALAGRASAAYVSACDVPLLAPRFVARVAGFLGEYDLALPRDGKFSHPLAAVYRATLAPLARQLITSGEQRLLTLPDRCKTRWIDAAELRDVDPGLVSLQNINSPADYAAALRAAGFPDVPPADP